MVNVCLICGHKFKVGDEIYCISFADPCSEVARHYCSDDCYQTLVDCGTVEKG